MRSVRCDRATKSIDGAILKSTRVLFVAAEVCFVFQLSLLSSPLSPPTASLFKSSCTNSMQIYSLTIRTRTCIVSLIFDVPRCCDVWNDLFSDWHRQRVDDSNRISTLFATQRNIKSKQEAKPHLQFIAQREELLEVASAMIVHALWKIVDERIP
jgi:hypothetical protein